MPQIQHRGSQLSSSPGRASQPCTPQTYFHGSRGHRKQFQAGPPSTNNSVPHPARRLAPMHAVLEPQTPSLNVSLDAQAMQGRQEAASVRPIRRLVVAVNDTKESWCAVKWTLNNIYRDGDILHLVHFVPKNNAQVPLPATFLANINDSMDYEEMLEAHAYEFINSTMVEMASDMKAQCQVDVLHVAGKKSFARNAGDAVCKYSEDLKAELVVIASQPMSGLDEFFTGGCMSGHALEHCKLPILILPPSITNLC